MIRACALGVAVLGAASVAHADDKAEAMVLFEQGIEDMQAGKTDLACRELSASLQKYEDSGTKGALAECYTQLGRIASAWRLWKELADTAPTDELRADAASNAAALAPRLPKFKLVHTGAVVPGLTVTVNDRPADPQLSIELPVDPGSIVVNATAPDHQPWTSSFTAFEGRVTAIEIPTLPRLPEKPPTATPAVTTKSMTSDARSHEEVLATRKRRQLLGGTLAITGVVSAGVATWLGLSASSSWREAKDACMGTLDPCRGDLAVAQDLTDDARLAARLSTGLFVIGGGALITGVVLWLSAPEIGTHSARLAPSVGPDHVGIVLSGSLR